MVGFYADEAIYFLDCFTRFRLARNDVVLIPVLNRPAYSKHCEERQSKDEESGKVMEESHGDFLSIQVINCSKHNYPDHVGSDGNRH